MAAELLEIHNRGYARDLNLQPSSSLIQAEGWHNLRNDLTGEIGFEFQLSKGAGDKFVTHLGIWDSLDREQPVRPARSIPSEFQSDRPRAARKPAKGRRLQATHTIRLARLHDGGFTELAQTTIGGGRQGELTGAFRRLKLDSPARLREGARYQLLMSTIAGDGDPFRDPASFDGLSPLVHPDITVLRSVLIRDGRDAESITAFADLHPDYGRFRLPVGPTMQFAPTH